MGVRGPHPSHMRTRLLGRAPSTTPPRSRSVPKRTHSASPEEIVREGWNRLSTTYRPQKKKRSDFFGHRDSDYRAWLSPIIEEFPFGSRVLELGCGTGEPAGRELARRFDVTGVDISEVMIRRARANVPTGKFRRADMTRVRFPRASFAAVVSLYAMIHVPVAKQRALLTRVHSWLVPRGLFLSIVGHGAWEGTQRRWLGRKVAMFWSHADAATFRRWLREIGFTVLRQEYVPEGKGGHALFLARKRVEPSPRVNPRPSRARERR